MDQVNSVGVFSSPKKLYDLADTATSAVTTDSELDSVGDLAGMAKMLKGIKSDDIQMSTLPVTYDPPDPNRVVPMESKARKIWSAIKQDAADTEVRDEGLGGRPDRHRRRRRDKAQPRSRERACGTPAPTLTGRRRPTPAVE